MTAVRRLTAGLLFLGILTSGVYSSENAHLKKMPKGGDIPLGKIVYVDDGECPRGEVKEVTGGSQVKDVPRKVRCVKRPDKAPRTGN